VIVFDLNPSSRPSPLVVEVPHAGLEVPGPLAEALTVDEGQRHRDADLFVDRVYAGAPTAGAPLLVACLSRYVCDLNRDPDDVDEQAVSGHPHPRPSAPRGFIWRMTTEGRPSLSRPLTMAEWRIRRDRIWERYHRALRTLLDGAREQSGWALLVAGHSMPTVGRAMHQDPGRRRADVVIGVRGGTSCAGTVRDAAVDHFRKRGYEVTIDDPYRGGATTARYGRPDEGIHALQIELSRALYMNEETLAVHDGFSRIRGDMDGLFGTLSALPPP